MRRLVLFLLLLLTMREAQSKNEIVYIGGGGERGRATNAFDHSMITAQILGEKRNARTTFFVDIEHPSTKKLLSESPSLKAAPLKSTDIEKGLTALIARIKGPEIKDGESLLVVVETHGLESIDEQVRIQTMDGLLDVEPYIAEIIKAAAAKGVKVGLVLGNCYSGTQLARFAAGNNACMVSASAPNRASYTGFLSGVLSKLGNSRTDMNLESAYLEARKTHLTQQEAHKSYVDFPQISTEAGLTTMAQMSVFSRRRFEHHDRSRALRDQIACEFDLEQIVRLKGLASEVVSATDHPEIEKALNRLRRTTKRHGLSQEEIDERVASADHLEVSEVQWCIRNTPASEQELKRWVLDSQTTYCEALRLGQWCVRIGAGEHSAPCSLPLLKTLMSDRIFNARSAFLGRTLDDVARELQYRVNIRPFGPSIIGNKEERILYDGIYRSQSKVLSKTANACRDFKL